MTDEDPGRSGGDHPSPEGDEAPPPPSEVPGTTNVGRPSPEDAYQAPVPPPGAYPAGTYPPGTYPPAAYPPGNYPPGGHPGTYPPPDYPPPPWAQQPPAPPPPFQYGWPGPASANAPPYQYAPPAYRPGSPPYGYGYGYPTARGPFDGFGRPMAGWWQRVGAFLLDSLIVGVPGVIIVAIVGAATSTKVTNQLTGTTTSRVGAAFWVVWSIVLGAQILYFAILDGQNQTVGKRAVGIAVRHHTTGQPIGFGRALGRWLIYWVLWYVFFIPGLLNALSPLWDSKCQAWHDHAVGSFVVRIR